MAVGDVTVKGLEDRSYTLNFGVNAMCRLEEGTGRSYHEVIGEIRTGIPRMTTIRQFIKAALAPTPDSDDQVGEILEDIGGAVTVIAAFMQSETAIAKHAAQPPVERPAKRRATKRTRKA